MRRLERATSLLCVAVVGLALTAPAGVAEPAAGGRTKLTLSEEIIEAVRRHQLQIGPRGSAQLRAGRMATFPVSRRSQLDLVSAEGTVLHRGALRFAANGRAVRLSRLRLETESRSLSALLAGEEVQLARAEEMRDDRNEYGNEVWARDLRLTAAAAALLDRALGLHLFRPGMLLGTSRSSVKARWDPVAGGTLQFGLDPQTFAKLEAIGVEPSPIAAAVTGSAPTTYTAPLTGGRIYPFSNRSFATTESGLRLRRESPPAELIWTDLGADLASPTAGALAALEFEVRIFGGEERKLTLPNVAVRLQPDAAQLINETFAPGGPPVVAAGDRLGTFLLTLQGR
ncbi:MAG TPA: hypothetical protein VKB23_00205 [Solirubrobacterales bacterium]|nr:hypothetical protein [Solirubrobacterales bacterium]